MASAKQFIWDEAKFTGADGKPIYVFEITFRVAGGRHMLAPDDEQLVKLHWGVLAQARQHSDFELYSVHLLSNHGAVLVGFRDALAKMRFTQFVAGNLARETNIRRNTSGPLWECPSRAIQVHTEKALFERLKYNLANGTKEGLVPRPNLWPGVHAAKPLEDGKPGIGTWIDRTKYWTALKKNPNAKLADYAKTRKVHFAKIPPLSTQTDKEYRATITEMCKQIVRERRMKAKGKASLGVSRVSRQGCWKKCTKLRDRTGCCEANLSTEEARARRQPPQPAPVVHTVGMENRERYRAAYGKHVAGLKKLRKGIVAALGEAVEAGNYTVESLLAGIRPAPV